MITIHSENLLELAKLQSDGRQKIKIKPQKLGITFCLITLNQEIRWGAYSLAISMLQSYANRPC